MGWPSPFHHYHQDSVEFSFSLNVVLSASVDLNASIASHSDTSHRVHLRYEEASSLFLILDAMVGIIPHRLEVFRTQSKGSSQKLAVCTPLRSDYRMLLSAC